jgi:RNA polymerase sigma-70 factor (ECF subfamily)
MKYLTQCDTFAGQVAMKTEDSPILFASGNDQVVAEWYNKWKAELFLVAFHYSRNSEDAEDILSDCFIKLLQMHPKKRTEKFIEQEINVKALLLVMVKNRCLDEIKQRQNRKRIIGEIMHLFNYSSFNKSIDNIDKACFEALCECLPEKERSILLLNIDGFSHQEISVRTGLSEKTISNNLTLARKKVKELWEDFMS